MLIKGFQASAVIANMRYKDRFDLGLIVADALVSWAGVFTTSNCCAAPVIWSRARALQGRGRAFLVNAGQANAQTGTVGAEHCVQSAQALAKLLGFQPEEVMLASTGIIGQFINWEAMEKSLPHLTTTLRPDALDDFSQAILTTDTKPKTATCQLDLDGTTVNIWGCVKGSGMIAPQMATMLGFILTDADLPPELLASILKEGADLSFNRATIDGDTSTNDSVLMMASGASGAPTLTEGPLLEKFKEAAFSVMLDLARQLVRDGEGATKLVTVAVKGAATLAEAQKAARTVAESPLVKTAFFGEDANWGRICMAIGRSGASFDPYAVDIDLDDVPWIRKGVDNNQEEAASAVMKKPEYTISIDLKAGSYEWAMLTCDFSHDYVTINGSYRS